MLGWLILGSGALLESLLLVRGRQTKLLGSYYFFYTYLALSLIGSLILMGVHLSAPGLHEKWFWPIQLITLVAGYGILLEILNHVLAPYPGVERFARLSGISAFAVIFAFALTAPRLLPHWSPGTLIEFERDMRCVQSIFICALLALIFYYAIPLGKNMKGMVVAYGLYILTSLVSLAVRSYAGTSFDRAWNLIQPFSFDASLVIWLAALWSYSPNPTPDPGIRLEEDYEALVSMTRRRIDNVWSHLGRTTRL